MTLPEPNQPEGGCDGQAVRFLRAVLYAGPPCRGQAKIMQPSRVQESAEEGRPGGVVGKEPRLLPGTLLLCEGLAAKEKGDTRRDTPEESLRGACYPHPGREERHDTRRDTPQTRWRTDVCGPWDMIQDKMDRASAPE